MNRDTITHSDALVWLRTLPDESVNCVVTSPPYYNLRDYGIAGQVGLEETPQAYIANLMAIFCEVKRVLRHDGTCWVNLGDSYNGSGKGQAVSDKSAIQLKKEQIGKATDVQGLAPKNLIGIPWRFAFAMQDNGWILRSDIIWHKPSCMPESVTDRPTKSHEYVFLFSKSGRYYYDADAIREPQKEESLGRVTRGWNGNGERGYPGGVQNHIKQYMGKSRQEAMALPGRNKRSVWTIDDPAVKLRDDLTNEQRRYVIEELLRRGLL